MRIHLAASLLLALGCSSSLDPGATVRVRGKVLLEGGAPAVGVAVVLRLLVAPLVLLAVSLTAIRLPRTSERIPSARALSAALLAPYALREPFMPRTEATDEMTTR